MVAKRTGIDHAYLSKIQTGRLRIPPRHADRIAEVLALTPAERRAFLLAVHVEGASPFLRDYIRDLQHELSVLRSATNPEGRS